MTLSSPLTSLLRRLPDYPGKTVTLLSAAAALILFYVFTPMIMDYTKTTYPYEDWDEIATFNSSLVIGPPQSYRTYRYGSLDTARFIAANFYYQNFDPIGKTTLIHTFSNSRAETWDDPFFAKRITPPAKTIGPDYSYYRGVNDREPIFIARKIYAASVLLAHALLILALCYYLRSRAGLLLILPFVFYCNIYFFGEAALARGNAFNAILAMSILFLLMIWLMEKRSSALYLACITVALGAAHKFDFLYYSLPVIIAAIGGATQGERPVWSLTRTSFFCFLAFSLALLVFWPFLLVNPVAEANLQFATLRDLGGNTRPWSARTAEFAVFAEYAFHMTAASWSVLARNLLPFLTVFLLPFLFFTCTKLSLRVRIVLFLIALCGPLHWAYIHLNAWSIVPRYLLTGMAFSIATLTCVIHCWFSSRIRWQQIMALVLVTLSVYSAHKLYQDRKFMTGMVRTSIENGHGLWENNSRNKAVVHVVELAEAGGYSPLVLVDQHSYTDLRYLRLKGLEPRYVHANNLAQTLADLPEDQSYLVIFTPGEPVPTGYWGTVTEAAPEFIQSYRQYRAAIEALPLLQEYGTITSLLLDYGQLDAETKMQVRVYHKTCSTEVTGNTPPASAVPSAESK